MTADINKIMAAQGLLSEIQDVCDEFRLHSLNKTLRSVRNFAEQNQYIDVAVLGQFKAGKSSFLNSLLNKSILPVGNIPVTAVISRISYGPEEKATVVFADGSSRQISSQEIEEYVSETGNPENQKNVLLVDIELPSLETVKTVRLVDTPGIGSVWKHNTETTTSWFPETGAVLFVISAEKPISENELGLLQEIYLYSPEIIIVLSKTDLFDEDHLKQMEC
jgi:predicted GTPase